MATSPTPDLPTPITPDPPDPGELPVEPDQGPAGPVPPPALQFLRWRIPVVAGWRQPMRARAALSQPAHPQFMRAAAFRWPATTLH